MFDKFNQIFKFNIDLWEVQKRQIVFLIVLIFVIKFILEIPLNSIHSKDDLKININTATFEELQKVPYIGVKTAEKIIKFRRNYGYIEDINQLKGIRNFKRFKHYIKTK